jgi:AcrR family transcriptional regulator
MTRHDVIKDYRVREILEAARTVLGRFGIEGTTIDRTAKEAGIGKGTIYLYFQAKDDLVHAAIQEGIRSLNAEMVRADDATLKPIDRLRHLIRVGFRVQASNEDFLKTFILGNSLQIEPDSPRGREYVGLYRQHLDWLAALIQDGIDKGAVRAVDPQFAATMLSEMMTASLRRRVLGITSTPIEEDADKVVELFLKGVQAAHS